jgi:dTDP-4-dehydrorhamnose reductase
VKVLITGCDGLLGKDLMAVMSKDPEVLGVNHRGLDVTDLDRVREMMTRYKPVAVVHAAALTHVDGCESRRSEALRINALGTQNIALACQEVDAALVYLSTDYVFDGTKEAPYAEWDMPNPINVYGQSKLAGEMVVRELLRKFYIVRTSGLYGRHGRNFIMSILEGAQQSASLDVVVDQQTLPTYTVDLANAIARLVRTRCYGTYHITNTADQGITWSDWAEQILRLLSFSHVRVNPVSSTNLDRPARRPSNSVLASNFYGLRGLPAMRPCDEALQAFLREVGLLEVSTV